jgi:sulfane dehydrogenase subunit SoxC
MTQASEEENRMLPGEAEGRSAPHQASAEAHREQTNTVRVDWRDGRSATHLTRRGVLGRLAGAAGGLFLGGVGHARAAAPDAPSYPIPADPTKVLGRGISPYGFRSQFETAVRWLFPTPVPERGGSMTPLHEARGIITPSALHYELHHGGVPTIDPTQHTLLIHGLVKRPLTLTVDDLMRFPSVNRIAFLECSGNGFREWRQPTGKDVQQTHGLLSGSEWTGVALSTLLREVGLQPGAHWFIAEGADAARMNRSIPLDKAWDDALIAYGQNGEALRPEQGYPMRLLLPGWEGNTNIKWLHVIKVTDKPYQTRQETARYTDLVCQDGACHARQFTFVMDAKSVITSPSAQYPLQRGFVEIRGLAWSGRGKIIRVEVSTDGGQSWGLAALQDPILPKALTVFRFPWQWEGQETILQSRCTDESGYIQPTRAALIGVRGLAEPFGSFYHYNAIQSWSVAGDGSIHNVQA